MMCILKCFEEVSGLKVNFDKSKLYGIGVNSCDRNEMARWMTCSTGDFPFTYLGLSIGERISGIKAWRAVIEKFKNLLVDWKAKSMSFGGRLTLVKSVLSSLPLYYFSMFRDHLLADHGEGGLNIGSLKAKNWALLGREFSGGGVWRDIIKVVMEIDGVGIDFTSSFICKVGIGRDVSFWLDRWIGDFRLCDRFPRSFHLDSRLEGRVVEKGRWVEGVWRDQWRWNLNEDGGFTVKDLTRMVEERTLQLEISRHDTIWNKLVTKKVNIFVWRALKKRLPIREELDKRVDSEVIKGLSKCKASKSKIRHIRVKDIVKKVKDYLKTYSSAGIDISCVVDENLPQLLDSRGGSHVTNVPAFDKEDFTSWKVRFLVFLDGLEPYLLKTLEDGPFVPMSSLSTSENPLPKRQNQWSNAESRLANQDKRLKSIIISCLPNDVMKSVIKCKTAKEMWNDLILAHEGPSDTRDTKIAALRLKFNAFKSLEGEKVNGTFTRLKCLLNDLENNGVTIPQAEVNATFVNSLPRKWLSMNQTQKENNSIKNDCLATLYGKHNYEEGLIDQIYDDSDVEEDQRTSNEFLAELNAEYHERALLANQKRFYKSNHQKYCKGKYKVLKAEMAILTKRIDDISKGKGEKGKKEKEKSEKGLIVESFDKDDESVSSDDEGSTKIKAFMAVVEDEPSVGKADARSGQ
ncbi:retrovirus-related pol polyprotein from transposon TNT 1-94 [Tanacetum coccineum]